MTLVRNELRYVRPVLEFLNIKLIIYIIVKIKNKNKLIKVYMLGAKHGFAQSMDCANPCFAPNIYILIIIKIIMKISNRNCNKTIKNYNYNFISYIYNCNLFLLMACIVYTCSCSIIIEEHCNYCPIYI